MSHLLQTLSHWIAFTLPSLSFCSLSFCLTQPLKFFILLAISHDVGSSVIIFCRIVRPQSLRSSSCMYIHRSKNGGTPITSGFLAWGGCVGESNLWCATRAATPRRLLQIAGANMFVSYVLLTLIRRCPGEPVWYILHRNNPRTPKRDD